jgi:hypothetical protein
MRRDERPPAAQVELVEGQPRRLPAEHQVRALARGHGRHFLRRLPDVEGRPLAITLSAERDHGVGPRHRGGEVVEDLRLLEHVVGAPRGAPALHRAPVSRGDQRQPFEAGIADRPRGRAHVGRDLGADEHDADGTPGDSYDVPSFTGGMKWM